MKIIILLLGLAIGFVLNAVIVNILKKMSENNDVRRNTLSILVYAVCFFTSYIMFDISFNFFRAVILAGLLVIISFVDLNIRIIPDYMAAITLISGIILSFVGGLSLKDSLLGMLCGGGMLFLLSLVPNSLGGGDIKLMFALGSFLGPAKVLWAILLSFTTASAIIILLLILGVCGRKDYIPFGPFLSLGSFITLIIFI